MKCKNCNNKEAIKYSKYSSGDFCSRKCARSFSTKLNRKEINRRVSKKLKGCLNLHLIKPKKYCKVCSKEIYRQCKTNYCSKHIFSSEEHKIKMSKATLKAYEEGKDIYGGTTRWINVNTSNGVIKVQGTYEKRLCFILDNWKKLNKILDWEYTKDRFEYLGINNKKHFYLVDFKIFNNDKTFYYIETKGYKKENDELKWKSVRDKGYRLDVFFNEDLKKLESVIVV